MSNWVRRKKKKRKKGEGEGRASAENLTIQDGQPWIYPPISLVGRSLHAGCPF